MNRFDLENLGLGIGLRSPHYAHILRENPRIDWFEALTENFLYSDGRPRRILEQIAAHYPVVLHGVSLSIGSTDRLDEDYLRRLVALRDHVGARWVSDHLCWTGVQGRNVHDLLPVPYSRFVLEHIADRLRHVQDRLGAPLALENPSSYLELRESTMSEWDFLAELAERADCALLLDVNNVYVSAFNHGFDAPAYLEALPLDRVVQIHLAGHSERGPYILDTHDDHVKAEVWDLYRLAISRCGGVSTLVEWDAHIPPFEVVFAEVQKARDHGAVSPEMSRESGE
ncbi:MAG: DUF692 domain-containing protein [Planctomycetota bacterium]